MFLKHRNRQIFKTAGKGWTHSHLVVYYGTFTSKNWQPTGANLTHHLYLHNPWGLRALTLCIHMRHRHRQRRHRHRHRWASSRDLRNESDSAVSATVSLGSLRFAPVPRQARDDVQHLAVAPDNPRDERVKLPFAAKLLWRRWCQKNKRLKESVTASDTKMIPNTPFPELSCSREQTIDFLQSFMSFIAWRWRCQFLSRLSFPNP